MSRGFGPDEDAVLSAMTNALAAGPEIYPPSKFWAGLNRVHVRRLEEPAVGNPSALVHRGRVISQDLCNSIQELYSVFGPDGGAIASGRNLEVAELGAGYGRLAYVVVSASPGVRYTIIDIPPALYLSQRYLTTVFPGVATFRFRAWTDYADVSEEFDRARIRLVLPHQAALLPERSVDYFVNISQLHEMSRPQVERYFALMDRICRGRGDVREWHV